MVAGVDSWEGAMTVRLSWTGGRGAAVPDRVDLERRTAHDQGQDLP